MEYEYGRQSQGGGTYDVGRPSMYQARADSRDRGNAHSNNNSSSFYPRISQQQSLGGQSMSRAPPPQPPVANSGNPCEFFFSPIRQTLTSELRQIFGVRLIPWVYWVSIDDGEGWYRAYLKLWVVKFCERFYLCFTSLEFWAAPDGESDNPCWVVSQNCQTLSSELRQFSWVCMIAQSSWGMGFWLTVVKVLVLCVYLKLWVVNYREWFHLVLFSWRIRVTLVSSFFHLENPNLWAPTISLYIYEFSKSMGHGGSIDGGEGSGVVCTWNCELWSL